MDELVTIPADLTLLSDADLATLEGDAVTEFNRLNSEDVSPDALEYQLRLSSGIDRIRAEKAGREARAAQQAELERGQLLQQRATLQQRVNGTEDAPPAGIVQRVEIDADAIAEAAARGATAALVAAAGSRGLRMDGQQLANRASTSLSAAQAHAPASVTPRPKLAVTAGVDIPGVARGASMTSLDDLISAFQRAAKGMPATRDGSGQPRLVATIRNEFEHVVDDRTSPQQVEELLRHLRRPEKIQALVAGGGWCAPSEIRYDFFNIAEVDGLIDLPTVGITRGGLQWPTSPSIADAFGSRGLAPFAVAFSNGSDPWLWTETDDQAAVTGSPTKPTIRVPCPSFTGARLECYGITLTAGNLTDDAYPEATANTLRLLLAAWEHAKNARYLSQMVAGSVSVGSLGATGTAPATQTVINGVDLAVMDYKAKYGMADASILEVVLPYWVKDVIQADLHWRKLAGLEAFDVTDGDIDRYFATEGIRVQWVNDWQVRGAGQFGNASTPMTAWPTSAQFMVYAPGTFVRGNGMTLDLGVVRDSVLNATNDFTAAWSEECHLIAKVGHESRLYTLNFGVNGAVGGDFYAAGSPTARI